MRSKRPLIFLILAITFWGGCDTPINTAYQEQLVVGAFIYAGEPIDSIVLHRTTPFGAYYDDMDYAVDSATVIVTVDGMQHHLLPAALKGRYYLPGSELVVQSGKTYQLSITAPNNQTGGTHNVTAATTVPSQIHLTSLVDSIRGRSFVLDTNSLASFAFLVTANPINDPDPKYMLSMTALDTSFGRIHPKSGLDSTQTTRYSVVFTGPMIALTSRLVAWYGPTLLNMYAIDTNWADYQRQVIGQGINYEPSLNHIAGGIGIFGSGSRDTVSFFIKPKP